MPPSSPMVLAQLWVWFLGELSGTPSHGCVGGVEWPSLVQEREDATSRLAVRGTHKRLLPFKKHIT